LSIIGKKEELLALTRLMALKAALGQNFLGYYSIGLAAGAGLEVVRGIDNQHVRGSI